MILKNVAGQGVYLFAVDTGASPPAGKTGDALNITGKISKDGAVEASFGTANPTEIGGGIYWQPLAQAETNANALAMRWSSSTSGIVIDPVFDLTSGVNLPAIAYDTMGGLPTTSYYTAVTSIDANLVTILGQAPTLDGNNALNVSVKYVGGTLQTAGDLAGLLVNGSYGLAALLAAVQNVQNNTFIATSIPGTLEVPDSGSATVNISIVFSDETGAAKNIDAGNPTIALVNDAGTDLSARLGAWTNPATGKYVIPYTNTAGDTLEGLHWDVTGTINSKLRRMVAYTQLVDTTAVDFTSSDRSNLTAVFNKLPTNNIADETLLLNAIGSPQQVGTKYAVTISAADVTGNLPANAVQIGGAVPGSAVIGTVTNVTNAPTAGDFTTTMKTSLNAATPAVTVSDKTGFKLASDGVDAITVESGLNLRQAASVTVSAAAGVLAGAAGTTVTIAAAGVPTTNRITATVDSDGNRSAVTLNPPA